MRIFLEYLKVGLWMLPIILPALWLLPRLSKRYAAKVSYVIWLVLAVRLLIPWNLTLPQETAPIHVAISEEQANEWVQAKFNPVQAPPKAEGTAAAAQKQTQPQAEPLQPLQIGFALWLAGVLVFVLRTVVSVFRMKALLRRWEKEPSAEAKAFFAETAGKTQPRLMVCPVLESPMAVGLFRTTVYLPHEHYTVQELEMIFRHELIHWRRKDLWYKLLLLAARSIHWCNPLVWLMAKRAERDLEISCDSMAVQGRDAAYRKAYGLMILQEAERSIEKQAALTTCFTDGKRALQERLVEIMNQSKRKKGMALVSVMLVLTLTCGCLISCGKDEKASESTQDTAASQGTLTAEQRKLTERWAEALSDRDGKIRYKEMGKAAKAQFIAEQKALDGEDWNYVIGGSSPWVDSYTIEERENAAMITYTMQDSQPAYYTMKELLKFGEDNGKTVVAGYLTSNFYWEDGKVHPTVSRAESDLDEGIWDFLSQSVVGFISQSKWDVYELEAFNFNHINVTRTPLSNGREQVAVDFGLNMHYRNPFRDPDEAGYIRRAKEAGQSVYAVYYKEYYEEKEGNTYFRFTCEVQADAQKINEDTCYPETFHLYNDDFDPHRITFYKKNPAWDGWYDETPTDGWFCTVTPAKDANTVTVARKIRIEDATGRTNNGYFDLNLDYTTTFPVAENAAFTVGGAGEVPAMLNAKEWLSRLQSGKGGQSVTLFFGTDANGNTVITEGREGFWSKKTA